ncbi:Transcription factor IIIA [Labeo rohita]|uniref:Transcription factor IIIA n=1 Tax=Labeo rohita TaxID=84645 RepID=A0ABQ8MT57_LABRO|nr:Transcription factor IIIA [Labeo rohita]
MLVQMLPHQKAHGWSHDIEVQVTLYCLACGASYRTVHNVVEEMMTILHKVIHFPKAVGMEELGANFALLVDHEAFSCAAAAINGRHIRILPHSTGHL